MHLAVILPDLPRPQLAQCIIAIGGGNNIFRYQRQLGRKVIEGEGLAIEVEELVKTVLRKAGAPPTSGAIILSEGDSESICSIGKGSAGYATDQSRYEWSLRNNRIFQSLSALVEKHLRCLASEAFRDIEQKDFPLSIPKTFYEQAGLLRTIPGELLGQAPIPAHVQASYESNRQSHQRGYGHLNTDKMTTLLKHSACMPLYPYMAGKIIERGRCFFISGTCFRNEKWLDWCDADHLREFHMSEIVFIGSASYCIKGLEKAENLWADLCSAYHLDIQQREAFDSFAPDFKDKLSAYQRLTKAKTEYRAQHKERGLETTCGSKNNHRNLFSRSFNITLSDGSFASSACMAFGIERIALALLREHG